jgi:hypothetical protein
MLAGVGLALDRHGRMGVIGMVATRLPMVMVMVMVMTVLVAGLIGPAGGVLGRRHRIVAGQG